MSPGWISSVVDIFLSFVFVDENFNTPRHRLGPCECFFVFSYRLVLVLDDNYDENFPASQVLDLPSFLSVQRASFVQETWGRFGRGWVSEAVHSDDLHARGGACA